jgi:hypothetical protein
MNPEGDWGNGVVRPEDAVRADRIVQEAVRMILESAVAGTGTHK